MEIKMNFSIKHAVITFIVLIFLIILYHTQYWPYANNQWKKHRWRSQYCVDKGQPILNCAISLPVPNSTEVVYFDVDLESGVWKRIK